MTRATAGTGSVYRTTITSRGTAYDYWCAQVDITTPQGKREYVRGFAPASLGDAKAQALAIKRRNEKLAQRLQGGAAPEKTPRSPKLGTFLEVWLSSYPPHKLADSGKAKYRRDFELHILPFLNKGIAAITEEELAELFYRKLPAEGRTPRSIYNAYAALRACLIYAEKKEAIPTNPLKGVEVKRPESSVSEDDDKWINRRVSMTKYMLKWLADPHECGPQLHEHYPLVLMQMLGLRRGELLGLEWSCFSNLDKKGKASFTVKQQLHRENGGRWFIHPQTKNKKRRSIPLPELWRQALLAQRAKGRVATQAWASDLVFLLPPGPDGASRWIDYNNYNKIWHGTLDAYVNHRRKISQPLTDSEKWRPHAQRHVAASLLFDSGVPLEVAQEILGHSDQAMTAYYTHLLRSKKQEATLALEAALNGPSTAKNAASKKGQEVGEDLPSLTQEQRELLIALLKTTE